MEAGVGGWVVEAMMTEQAEKRGILLSGQETLSPNLLSKLSEASHAVGDNGIHETYFFCVELRTPGA